MWLKEALYTQLAVGAWRRPGISPTNAVVIVLIISNLLLQALETEATVVARWGDELALADGILLWTFTVEYALRVWTAGCNPRFAGLRGRVRYVLSFYSLVDLLAIVPGHLTTTTTSPMRALRILRVLRFARFGAFSIAMKTLAEVVRSRVYELSVSLLVAVVMLVIASTAMYFAEGEVNEAFASVPRALWWSVVTMTTVGYGDATPVTPLGKVLAGFVAMISIAIVAIPTGILAASFSDVVQKRKTERHGARPSRRRPPMVS